MPTDFPYDVFLSHNANDKPRVRRLAERLRQAGLRVWFDEWNVRSGDIIALKVDEGLEQSRVLLLCLSPNALASDWVALERSTAIHRDPANAGRRFIPLLLADCELPDTMRRYKYVDFREEVEAAFEEVLASCRPAEEANSAPTTSHLPLKSSASLESISGLVPKVRSLKPDQGQTHFLSLHLDNRGPTTADSIHMIIHSSEVGLPTFNENFWKHGKCHVPYTLEANKSLNPGMSVSIFDLSFMQDPDVFEFKITISARDKRPEKWTLKVTGENSRQRTWKEAERVG